MNCAGGPRALPAFALGVAPTPDAPRVELHVETCAACRKEASDLQRAVAAFGVRARAGRAAGPELEDRVVAAVRAAAARSGSGVARDGSGGRGHAARGRDRARRARHRRRARQSSGAAAAAARAHRAAAERDARRFGEAVSPRSSSIPAPRSLSGMLVRATTAAGHGLGPDDRVAERATIRSIVIVSDLPGRALPLTVAIANAAGRALELGAIRRARLGRRRHVRARRAGRASTGFVDVVVRDARGRVVLRGTLRRRRPSRRPRPRPERAVSSQPCASVSPSRSTGSRCRAARSRSPTRRRGRERAEALGVRLGVGLGPFLLLVRALRGGRRADRRAGAADDARGRWPR